MIPYLADDLVVSGFVDRQARCRDAAVNSVANKLRDRHGLAARGNSKHIPLAGSESDLKEYWPAHCERTATNALLVKG